VETLETGWEAKQIIDAAIMQKLLPKLHGSRSKLSKVLITLGQLCLEGDKDVKKEFLINTMKLILKRAANSISCLSGKN
jgi:5-methylcytosine-specific restriction protein B